jgi:SAM-dependent methyltransferase
MGQQIWAGDVRRQICGSGFRDLRYNRKDTDSSRRRRGPWPGNRQTSHLSFVIAMSNPIRPVTRSKRQARDHYHRLSRWYDLLVGASEKKYRNLGLQRLEARPGERILEIGCGTGQAILSLAAAVGPTGLVCGLDLAAGMLAVSHARVGRAALADRVALLQGDAAGLPYAAGSFDAIFMSFTLGALGHAGNPAGLAAVSHRLAAGRPSGSGGPGQTAGNGRGHLRMAARPAAGAGGLPPHLCPGSSARGRLSDWGGLRAVYVGAAGRDCPGQSGWGGHGHLLCGTTMKHGSGRRWAWGKGACHDCA